MAEIKITQKRNNTTHIKISGELTIYCVMEFYQQHILGIKLKSITTLNLADIEEVDTAGVQLLIMLFKEIANQKSQSQIHSISSALIEYNQIFHLEHYFILHNTEKADNKKTIESGSVGESQ
jgi:ABC-type transporter Mla MlaB component